MPEKVIAQSSNFKIANLDDGTILFVGNKEVEICSEVHTPSSQVENPLPKSENSKPTKRKSTESLLVRPMAKKERKSLPPNVHVDYEPLVMPAPNDSHQWQCNEDNLSLTPVEVSASLCRVLRKHQREGVTFLYNCVSGLRDLDHRGAILADEMGLGKTLQVITLIWTLLSGGPYGNLPLLKKVLIVVPSSLVQNWKNEFIRWLGSYRLNPFVVDKDSRPKEFPKSSSPVLIISYEMFVKSHADLKCVNFDLIICDEGHRLKNSNIQATMTLKGVNCQPRILLTGTPIQNDLQEFYALVDFVNPGILGSPAEFGRNFEKPILASKEPHSSAECVETGRSKAEELNRLTSGFILRRTQEIIGKYLPQKTEYVVFCEATEFQRKLYSIAVNFWTERLQEVGSRDMPQHLSVIMAMKKICNHPHLLKQFSEGQDLESLSDILNGEIRENFRVEDSSKMMFVDLVLNTLGRNREKIILVSNFTQTLDLLADLCSENRIDFLRFDGSTPTSRRNEIVSKFNSGTSPVRVLLLSSKAGGVGLNLIGASRLILFDSDWNPATDLQAMARIWREGQRKNVHIYRLLTSASIEEKIFQRQLKKTELSESIVDSCSSSSVKLSKEELRDLFELSDWSRCLTHDSLKCECQLDGSIPGTDGPQDPIEADRRDCQIELNQSKGPTVLKMNQLLQWEHYGRPFNRELLSEIMLTENSNLVNFVFRNKTS
ncbi:unnamed protein product [Nesidiocoris tenuis]|uniref:DNA repair and recombination protein RAD54-like n=1 Tax=Nesidiocoris tenuis TaxID=355587 RepID=A0A6H5GL11_9HEMI|nr:unnamed protein product [Nesidiocoris tenuis]